MIRLQPFLLLAYSISFGLPTVQGSTIFESASIGQTGLPIQSLLDGTFQGVNVLPQVFPGVRFELTESTDVTAVGGHLVANTVDGGSGSIFAVIVALDSATDFPDSSDFSTPDVLGSTLIPLPDSSADVSAELSLQLQPGWYAVVFGSGLFGASGFGAVLSNGVDVGSPSYIDGQSVNVAFWREAPSMFSNQRFFIEGSLVPEPSAVSLLAIGGSVFFVLRRKRKSGS